MAGNEPYRHPDLGPTDRFPIRDFRNDPVQVDPKFLPGEPAVNAPVPMITGREIVELPVPDVDVDEVRVRIEHPSGRVEVVPGGVLPRVGEEVLVGGSPQMSGRITQTLADGSYVVQVCGEDDVRRLLRDEFEVEARDQEPNACP